MQDLSDIIRRQHADRSPHDDPLVDRLIAQLVRVAEEVCVLRDRLETCQRLAVAGQDAGDAAIDAFEPDDTLLAERVARHKAYYEQLFRELTGAPATGQQ